MNADTAAVRGRFRAVGLAVAIFFLVVAIIRLEMYQEVRPLNPAPLIVQTSLRDLKADTGQAGPMQIRVHMVQANETLSQIAEFYQLDVETLLASNSLPDAVIYPGDQVLIPPGKGCMHTVTEDDTVWGISRAYGVDASAILTANALPDSFLSIGQKLFIPGGHMRRQAVSVARFRQGRMIWPVYGQISSGFGERWGSVHTGIDLAVESGTPVAAAKAGLVIYAGWLSGYGYAVMVEHGQGISTLYGHLSEIAVYSGNAVQAGDQIGLSGSTGNSTGPHLHFEVRQNGVAVNPRYFLP